MTTIISPRSEARSEALRPALRLLGGTIRLATMLSPELGGRLANRLWFGTQRYAEPARERTWRAMAETGSLECSGLRLATYAWGPTGGPTVLLMHGWHGRGMQLGAFAAPLAAAGFRVVTFDAPAHGRTPGRSTNLPEVAAALMAVAAAESAAGRTLHGVVAHSFGTTCTLHALDLGLKAARVVAISAPASIEFMMESFGDALGVPPPAREVHRRLMEERFGADVWERLSPLRIAATLEAQALLIHDAEDRDVPLHQGRALAQAWGGSQLMETTGLGHRRILREPIVVERTVKFLVEE
jgi:pimeloyl-ACP methyl ester carboxylesterase